ncbi:MULTISPECIES: DUF433 domain-containing protein [Crossiella]|uniref:Uncharacterized protein (DUF433 family) n=1 Tax=Crossiella cryophila TaxID=43355 RepID=A0A7W7C589_9PSEU|nr:MULTISPECIES: DUF433 domain-containing protein [Crossiella]MBB4674771.1 uncharacterized protein (DUF433 family) [Crossiella cryophila]MCK2236427.1 DUF433 domain-containing protein [Crossiella sp. S99.2]MCK2250094.1 DUF433 domain-containing protein [Crossiella sp. S99.1]
MSFLKVSQDPAVLRGVPVVTGTKIAVATVVALVCEGLTAAEIVLKHPDLEIGDVDFCLEYLRGGA